ncbi:MAG: bifunctional acetate--CoA ligase family protein/GNAT family N-acetyltransferase [Armatimonadetes bacterium]|nr:bifunctional acetate--CoA ligase family protein/GNAT family N-acetyltransferase [Armatimonadota bacterium]
MPPSSFDATYDILRQQKPSLDVFFTPKTVAVIGATETQGSVGRTLLWNLLSSPFGGTVFPVNPKRPSVLGIKAYPSITSVPDRVDLAVIATPAPTVPSILRECIAAGVKGAVIISAGFAESGEQGKALEREIQEIVANSPIRVVGPNCLGVMSPLTGLNATFAGAMARPGNVGFISQSGALLTAILDWSLQEMVGFSAFISIGAMADVSWGDLIDYLGNDPKTRSIVCYMESIGDARSFLSAAREVSLTKPIIVIKAGRSEAAARAAASHTGTLAGSDEVLDAAFRRCGVLRVNRISDIFDMADTLSKQPRPKGNRLTILTNAGGPGVLATDALMGHQGTLANLSEDTIEALNAILPQHWSHSNPVDILGDATAERYAQAVDLVVKDPNSDGLLIILTPQAMTESTRIAEQLKAHAHESTKPILASWMGGVDVVAGERILNKAGIPTFDYPDGAARAFCYMWQYTYNMRGIYETPTMTSALESSQALSKAQKITHDARNAQRTLLTEKESKDLLAAYGIPTVQTDIAKTAEEAINCANSMGYPVVLKLHSETITHKTDVGGVQLNLQSGEEVQAAYTEIQNGVTKKVGAEHFQGVTVQKMARLKDAYEVILGSALDAQFGPVLLFGMGGQLVEVFRDRALALPPLNSTLARRMMEQTHIYKALQGVRGRNPVDLNALEQIIVRFGDLVVENRAIKEIEINPLLVYEEGVLALDARVVLHPKEVNEEDLPRLAIRPYPSQYVAPYLLPDGSEVVIRPIRPEDEPLMVKFHETLSAESVYLRYFHLINLSQRVAHERLTRICFNDYDRELALVVEKRNTSGELKEILAIGRLSKQPHTHDAEFSMIVNDRWQRQGIGTEVLKRLVQIGRDEKVAKITSDILPANYGMQRICQKLGFTIERKEDVMHARLVL